MARKRAPEHDYICQRCGCACNPTGGRHLGGGSRDMRACPDADPILRSAHNAEVAAVVAYVRSRR